MEMVFILRCPANSWHWLQWRFMPNSVLCLMCGNPPPSPPYLAAEWHLKQNNASVIFTTFTSASSTLFVCILGGMDKSPHATRTNNAAVGRMYWMIFMAWDSYLSEKINYIIRPGCRMANHIPTYFFPWPESLPNKYSYSSGCLCFSSSVDILPVSQSQFMGKCSGRRCSL